MVPTMYTSDVYLTSNLAREGQLLSTPGVLHQESSEHSLQQKEVETEIVISDPASLKCKPLCKEAKEAPFYYLLQWTA